MLFYLLMAVFVLMSGGANAHGTADTVAVVAAHHHSHSQNDHHAFQNASNDANHPASAASTGEVVASSHTDICSHTHCGHSHAAGVVAAQSTSMTAGATAFVPRLGVSWASSAITDNIERPKWQITTPAVVSLLS